MSCDSHSHTILRSNIIPIFYAELWDFESAGTLYLSLEIMIYTSTSIWGWTLVTFYSLRGACARLSIGCARYARLTRAIFRFNFVKPHIIVPAKGTIIIILGAGCPQTPATYSFLVKRGRRGRSPHPTEGVNCRRQEGPKRGPVSLT